MGIGTFEKLPADKKEMILSTGIREFSQKAYKDVSTDSITRKCHISKGILFHYFGSKKGYYMYCLEASLERLMSKTKEHSDNGFYEILFESMNRKMAVCMQYKDEMHMVNMASRDAAAEIAQEKTELIGRYMAQVQAQSLRTLQSALLALDFKSEENRQVTVEGLHIYINAVLNKYLVQYQQTPDDFFKNREKIKEELKQYLDVMLYGIYR